MGWRRRDGFEETGLPWVMPSPNMPTVDTAFVYPGLCLIEGTNLSEGRGTTRPFEIIGAPFLDGYRLAERLGGTICRACASDRCPSGRPFTSTPASPAAGSSCTSPIETPFAPTAPGWRSCASCGRVGGDAFAWRTEPYEFVSNRPAIDLLTGGDAVRLGIERAAAPEEIFATWLKAERAFPERRRPYLLYE